MSMTLQQPTRARYWVVFFAVTLAILAYIDRVAISKAAPMITATARSSTLPRAMNALNS